MRDFLKKNGGYLVAILLIAAVSTFVLYGRSKSLNISHTFLIDEETGEESLGSIHDVPPLLGKSGKPTVVRVFKFTCDHGKTVKVGYYSKYNDGTKKQLDATYAANKSPDFDASTGLLIRSPEKGAPWVHWGTPDATTVLDGVSCPEGHDIETVLPP